MNFTPTPTPRYNAEEGFYHLTPEGWLRTDAEHCPNDRIETWKFESETPSPTAKTNIHLTRVWVSPATDRKARMALHFRFGEPIEADVDRNIVLGCRV